MLPSTKKDSLETEGAQGRLFTLKEIEKGTYDIRACISSETR